MKNVWKSYRREKSKMLKNWIKQQISRKLKMENTLQIAVKIAVKSIKVKSWIIQVVYTFVSN